MMREWFRMSCPNSVTAKQFPGKGKAKNNRCCLTAGLIRAKNDLKAAADGS
jgi:hypothetical protein